MKVNLKHLMFDDPVWGENGFVSNTTKIAPGDQFPVNTKNVPTVAQSELRGQYITASRIGQACEKDPNFTLQGYDINDCAFGVLNIAGDKAPWRCDGNVVWVGLQPLTLYDAEDSYDSFMSSELRRLALYPFVAWYENKNPEIAGFREKYRNKKATTDDCLRFSLAFEYGFVKDHPKIECKFVGAESPLCKPAVDRNIVVSHDGGVTTVKNGLPWQTDSDTPTPLTIQSAISGKFNLAGKWGQVTYEGKSYDFSRDMVSSSELQDYIDNGDFRDVLQQVLGYIGGLLRVNKLTWDGKTPINQFLEEHNVSMGHSNQQNIMLAGEPGSGKTQLCRTLAAALGLPCLIIRLSERAEKDELTQEVVATDHGFDTLKSALFYYVTHGGLVVFDDLSNADPNMFFSVTGGLLEAPYEYSVNQQIVKRHPLCIIMATANVGTIGSQPMNEALLTRFGGHYVVERLGDDAFKKCIISRAQSNSGVTVKSDVQKKIADWTFNVFTSVSRAIKTVDRETADRLITMRAAIATAEKILNAVADGFPVDCKKAAQQTMANILYTGGNPTLQKSVKDAIDSAPSITI